jgi:3-polyprenyl-4-hydroxybenzoate decarboxylase
MVCQRVFDLGTQKTEFQGETKLQRKLMIGWEIPAHRVVIGDTDAPVLHLAKYTWSFHEKANLRKDLESWRGRKFKDEDFAGPPSGFHITKLLGVPCYGQIVHEVTPNGKTYANLTAIMAFPGKQADWPKLEAEPLFFDLDDFDAAVLARLSDYWQGVIKQSPEYAKATGGAVDHNTIGSRDDPMGSDIPF